MTDAQSPFDHVQSKRSLHKARQTMIDLLVVKDLVENSVVQMMWVLATHMLSDVIIVSGRWRICVAPDNERS